jgi:SagB-type dehydrogenase family enzyme
MRAHSIPDARFGALRRARVASLRRRSPALVLGAAEVVAAALGCQTVAAEPSPAGAAVLLPAPRAAGSMSLEEAIRTRRSQRSFDARPIAPDALGQLLFAAQGITAPAAGLRAAPSAGATYPLELYVVAPDGVHHYEPVGHRLSRVSPADRRAELSRAALGQDAVRDAAVDLVIAADVARTAARYGARADRYVLLEAGHAAQNVLLEATALDLGAVPIGAFDDGDVRALLALPAERAPLYVIAVGHAR